MKTVFTYGGDNPHLPRPAVITLEQHEDAHGLFRLTYGAQVQDHLSYNNAALHLGSVILHHLACEGEINNEGS